MRKRICFVVSSPLTAKAFLINHINFLAKEYDVYLVANFNGDADGFLPSLPIIEKKDISIHRHINLFKDISALLNLYRYFNAQKFDAIHTVTPKAGLLGIISSKIAGITVRIHIFTGQIWHTKRGVLKRFLMLLDRLIVFNATHILVDGESQRDFLVENNIVKSNQSFVLGKGSISGVDTDRFIPSLEVKNSVREELNIKQGIVVYMFLGRMNRDKGINELADAFDRLSKEQDNVCLLLVGVDEGDMVNQVKSRVLDLSKVIFFGPTNTPERILQACDVFCLPSHREGFGTSVIEASLLEKPVICSDTYGLMETIIDDETGLRHEVSNVESLYTQMRKLAIDKSLRDSLGKNGRKYVLKNFSAQEITSEWLGFYKRTL